MTRPHLVFATCSRADWAKLRPLVRACVEAGERQRVMVQVHGSHYDERQGFTREEVVSDADELGVKGARQMCPQNYLRPSMQRQFADTAYWYDGWARYLVVHGDRHEALAVATQGVIGGAKLIHVEAGERSGNVDDKFRDAITAMADIAFTALPMHTDEVRRRFRARPYTIGSPEYDELLHNPVQLHDVCKRYDLDISPRSYEVFLIHPETGPSADNERLCGSLEAELRLCQGRKRDAVIIRPNTDDGWSMVVDAYDGRRMIPSMRSGHFYALLKHAARFVTNSSAGVRMRPGCEVVLLGNRQQGREMPGCRWGDGKAGARFVRALKIEGVL